MQDRTAFIISLVVHIGFILFFVISTSAKFDYKKTYLPVQFAPSEPIEQEEPKPQKTKKPQPKEEDTFTEKKNTPRPTQKPKPSPTPKKPTPTPTKKPLLSKDLEKLLKEKLKATPKPKPSPTQQPTPKPSPTPAETKVPLDQINQTANEVKSATEFQYTIDHGSSNVDFVPYAKKIEIILERNWLTPTTHRPEMKEYATVVSFTVGRSGVIKNVQLEKSSGWPLMDKTVLQTFQRVNQFPPLPASYTADQIRVQFPFILELNQRRSY